MQAAHSHLALAILRKNPSRGQCSLRSPLQAGQFPMEIPKSIPNREPVLRTSDDFDSIATSFTPFFGRWHLSH